MVGHMHQSANAASVAIFKDRHVLLIQRALPPLQGLWTLPGGRLEPGETVEDCAIREVREEIGLRLTALNAVTSLHVGAKYTLAVFTSLMPPQLPQISDEIIDWCWALPDAITHLETTPGLAEVLAIAAQKSRGSE